MRQSERILKKKNQKEENETKTNEKNTTTSINLAKLQNVSESSKMIAQGKNQTLTPVNMMQFEVKEKEVEQMSIDLEMFETNEQPTIAAKGSIPDVKKYQDEMKKGLQRPHKNSDFRNSHEQSFKNSSQQSTDEINNQKRTKRRLENDVDQSFDEYGSTRKKMKMNHFEHDEIEHSLVNDENKSEKPLNDKTAMKAKRKIRREYFCSSSPTLLITPVNGKLLRSATSILKLFGSYGKQLALKMKTYTFSQSWKTLYLHFNEQVNLQALEDAASRFNQLHTPAEVDKKIEEQEEQGEDQKPKITMKCIVYSSTYVTEQKERRKQEVQDPEINKCVLLRNVSPFETEEDITETLKELGYNVDKVERFKGLPVVNVSFSTSEDVRKALEEQNIRIGIQLASCEPFDKYRRRPRSQFRQCKKCFGLNHFARDCTKAQVCKYCSRRNHKSSECFFKRKPSMQRCVLCKGQHASDSIMCHVIRQVREKIGIKFSRRENVIILKKEEKKNKQNSNHSTSKPKPKPKFNEVVKKSEIIQPTNFVSSEKTQETTYESKEQSPSLPSGQQSTNQQRKRKRNKNRNEQDEVAELKQEVSELRETVKELKLLIQNLMPLFHQQKNYNSEYQEETSEIEDDQ